MLGLIVSPRLSRPLGPGLPRPPPAHPFPSLPAPAAGSHCQRRARSRRVRGTHVQTVQVIRLVSLSHDSHWHAASATFRGGLLASLRDDLDHHGSAKYAGPAGPAGPGSTVLCGPGLLPCQIRVPASCSAAAEDAGASSCSLRVSRSRSAICAAFGGFSCLAAAGSAGDAAGAGCARGCCRKGSAY